MNGDTMFLLAGAVALAGAFFYTRKGRPVAAAAATAGGSRFGGSFRELDALADEQAYELLGRQYVDNRAKRRAVEIQGDLPSGPKDPAKS